MFTMDKKYREALVKMKQATELVRACERLLQDAGPLSDEDYKNFLEELARAVDDLEQAAWQGSPYGT